MPTFINKNIILRIFQIIITTLNSLAKSTLYIKTKPSSALRQISFIFSIQITVISNCVHKNTIEPPVSPV